MQEYIADRLHIPSGGITSLSAEQHLRPKGAPEEILGRLKEIFEIIDAERFAPASLAKEQMPAVLQMAREIVEGLEKVKL